MKKKAKKQPAARLDWDKIAEETRQRCNRLSDADRKELEDLAFRIIYGPHADPSVRRN